MKGFYKGAAVGTIRCGILPSTISLKIREPGSAITHFIGLILLLAGAGPLLMCAAGSGSVRSVFSMAVFLTSSALLYAASTLYHTVVLDEPQTRIFKKLDHSMIAVMIAGTYTPVCMLVLPGYTGKALLTAIWAMAAGGVALKLFWVTCPKLVSSVLYLCMGWLCLFALRPLLGLLPAAAFTWLLAGGLWYSAGALLYAWKNEAFDRRHPYFGTHEIFHLFIMAGTFCHYIFMFRYLA